MIKVRKYWRQVIRAGLLAVTVIAIPASIAGCSGASTDGQPDHARIELFVSAAISLQAGMDAIEQAYESDHPHVDLLLNYGSSGALQRQIEQGAPVDLFFSAGMKQMQALEEAGLAEQSKQLLSNALVAIASDEAASHMKDLASMLDNDTDKIAIGDPDVVPAGAYAREMLEAAGLWTAVKPKLVLAKDVRQVVTYVESGNAALGFVYRTDALSANIPIAYTVDPQLHAAIIYPAAVIRDSEHKEEAAELLDYLTGEQARAIFEGQGFKLLQHETD